MNKRTDGYMNKNFLEEIIDFMNTDIDDQHNGHYNLRSIELCTSIYFNTGML